MVYAYGLTAACLLGLGFVLQQHAAQSAPLADLLSFRLLLDLLHDRVWLAGIGCMVVGQIFGALALAQGDVSMVEPLLATNLLFAMALARRLSGQSLGWSGWAGVVLLSGGVAAFMLAGRPAGGSRAEIGALRFWLVFGGVLATALALVVVARHLRLAEEPPFLAAAAGVLYGLQDALTRMSSELFGAGGVMAVVTSWQPYTIVALAVTGLMLVQSAFETGPLRMSLPGLTAAEPLAGIVCGVGFLGDRLRLDPAALAWQAGGLLAVVAGVVVLGRHPAMPSGVRPADAGPRGGGDPRGEG
ncbi:DMT family transporter [Streptomyces sp. S465]|uniref:DMT family transporter n=1 Tax=Streptomyces sp. S465 TaxID=2979468 RepID=UPI0022A8BDDE|nr:DMT family transporter [Streptomyces sp. S465]WAP53675.1 DMT family transporter [Streptomyces sp. S465]